MPLFQRREARSLLATRSWVALTMASLSWLLTALVTLPRWRDLSSAEHVCIVIALVLIVLSIVLVRRPWSLWLTTLAMFSLGLTALVPSGTLVWTYPQTYFGYVGFLCSMLLPRRAGLVTCVAIPIGVWLIWQSDPGNVVPEAFSVADGWLLLVRMLGAQLLLWWSWWWLRGQADQLDRQWDSLRESQVIAQAEQERSTLWRDTAQRIHATMLNSINALLEARAFDPEQLRQLAAQGRAALMQPSIEPRRTPELNERVEPVNAGIVLITSALGGAFIGGSLYILFVPFPSLGIAAAAVACTLLACWAGLVIVVRRQRVPWPLATALVLVAASVPWLLASFPQGCDAIGAVSAAAAITGFAIVCIGLWSGAVPFVVGLIPWAIGAVLITRSTPAECSIAPTVIVLNVATFLPLVAIISIVGIRSARRSLHRLEQVEIDTSLAQTRAAALRRIDEEMSASVREAADLLDAIARRGAMSEEDEITLRCLAARMRASIQIDVDMASGFASDVYALIVQLAKERIPVEIGVLASSADDRPIPAPVRDLMLAAGRAGAGSRMRLQCLSTQAQDFLSFTVPAAATQAIGLRPGDERSVDGALLSVQEAEPEVEGSQVAVITVERDVRQSAEVVTAALSAR